MKSSFAKCSCPILILTFFTFLCNLGLVGLSGYILAEIAKTWPGSGENKTISEKNSTFITHRLHTFNIKDNELGTWAILCCIIYSLTIIATVIFVLARQKNSICLALIWLAFSTSSILLTAAVVILYILSYYNVLSNPYKRYEEKTTRLEIGIIAGVSGFYVICYSILVVLVAKDILPVKKKDKQNSHAEVNMNFINGGGRIEEVGTPEDVPGYHRYQGATPKHYRRPTADDRSRGVQNMYSEPSMDRTRSLPRGDHANDRNRAEEYDSTDVVRRNNPQKSSYRPNSVAKTNSEYKVEPYYEGDESESRSKRYSQYSQNELVPSNDPRGSVNAHANAAYDNPENLYQIPRAHSRRTDY